MSANLSKNDFESDGATTVASALVFVIAAIAASIMYGTLSVIINPGILAFVIAEFAAIVTLVSVATELAKEMNAPESVWYIVLRYPGAVYHKCGKVQR